MTIEQQRYRLLEPFSITGITFEHVDAVRVTLDQDGVSGRGECVGIYYLDDTAASIIAALEAIRPEIEAGLSRDALQASMSSGSARNAVDAALWDLESKLSRRSIWSLLDLSPRAVTTVCTLGISSPTAAADAAKRRGAFPSLKLKLDGHAPMDVLEAVRAARPDAEIIIDVNQGWTFRELQEYAPVAARLAVAMIEQPLARGLDEELETYRSPVPLGADESCLDLSEFDVCARRYDAINIKLDKCGGLTEALQMAERARASGKRLMVGNMMGSSLSMAPALVLAHYCEFVDIDGPLFLAADIEHGLSYDNTGRIQAMESELWG